MLCDSAMKHKLNVSKLELSNYAHLRFVWQFGMTMAIGASANMQAIQSSSLVDPNRTYE